jgi:hypothetical protein
MQPQIELLARDLGRQLAQRRVGDLVRRIMPGSLRHVSCEPALDVADAIARERGDHEGRGERSTLARRLGNCQQRRFLDEIDLVDEQDFGLADLGELLEDRARLFVETALRVDQHGRDIGIPRAHPCGRYHRPVEPALGRKDARRIDEHKLRAIHDRNAAQRRTRRLRLVGHDRDLGSDERIDQRRFADIGCADQRDESAARAFVFPLTRNAVATLPLRRGNGRAARAFCVSHRSGRI